MNKIEAQALVEKEVLSDLSDCSLMESSTEEFSSCFVFYYQSTKYIESGSFKDMYVGQGPVIVCKSTGNIFETGSAYPTDHYVNAFTACGDPFGEPTSKISITGWREGASAVNAIRCIKNASATGLSEAKSNIDQVLSDKSVVIDLSSKDKIESTIASLSEYGFESTQLWSNQC